MLKKVFAKQQESEAKSLTLTTVSSVDPRFAKKPSVLPETVANVAQGASFSDKGYRLSAPPVGPGSQPKGPLKYDLQAAFKVLVRYLEKRGEPIDSFKMRCVIKHLTDHPSGAMFNRRHNVTFLPWARVLRDYGLILSVIKVGPLCPGGPMAHQEVFFFKTINQGFDWVSWMEQPGLMWVQLPMPFELKLKLYQLPVKILDQMLKECSEVRRTERLMGRVTCAQIEENLVHLSRMRTLALQSSVEQGQVLNDGTLVRHEFSSYTPGRLRQPQPLSRTLTRIPTVQFALKIQNDRIGIKSRPFVDDPYLEPASAH